MGGLLEANPRTVLHYSARLKAHNDVTIITGEKMKVKIERERYCV
jgi:uncharacterized protein YegP (UPF0339 family)